MFLFHKKEKINKEKNKLDNVLKIARECIENTETKNVREAPVYALIRAMVNYQLYDIVRELYEGEEVTKARDIYDDIGEYYSIDNIHFNNFESFELGKSNININLSKDAVLVFAWNQDRFVKNLITIGENVGNKFEYQENNHMATYIYPLGLTIVDNGNHSTLSGILKGEGVIQVTQTYDLEPTYDYMYFDGIYFRKKENDEIIHKVNRFELGALYEIGRLLAKEGIR